MMSAAEVAQLKRSLWPAGSVRPVRIYAVLDCARNASIPALLSRSYREKSCLFAGELDPELERAAPFLLQLEPEDRITDELLQNGWKDAWGILVQTERSFRELRRHLRTLLRVRTEDGRFLLFRYYDPRTLNAYLPTCNPDELALLFGDAVVRFLSFSAETGAGISYTMQGEQMLAAAL